MASVYHYRSLQSTAHEIRVLFIEPDRNVNNHTPLRCQLKYMSLRDVLIKPFLAVSYCWGTSNKRAPIIIDGQNITIPQTAAVAIRNLSKVSSDPLWIDAVCIDQTSVQEKSQQVAMMKEVYSKAVSVLIWLGPAQISTANALASIEKIYKQCLEVIGGLEHLNVHLYGSDGSSGFKYSDASLPDCDWPALLAFYSAQWFGRLWVIQEIGLAKDSTVYVGYFSIGAEKVVLAARWMVHRKYTRYCAYLESPGIESASSMYRPAGRLLSNQLRRLHRASCREAQDRVYGLLGLLREDTASAIVANYAKPLVEVYAQAIRLALKEAGDLSFLQFAAWYKSPTPHKARARRLIQWLNCGCLVPQKSQDVHWPSWVLKIHGQTSDESGACRNVLVFNQSSMSSSFGLQTRILVESLTLSLRGVTIDTVSLVGPMFTVDLLKDSVKLAEAVKWCVQYGRKSCIPEDATYIEDLAICLTCGSNRVNTDAELDQTLVQAFGLFLQECRQLSIAVDRKTSRKLNRFSPWIPLHESQAYWHDLWSKAINRRFFVTATGMIGMGPPATKAEDLVCMLFGSEAPFVLRSLGRYFELIGDAYVRARGRPCNGKAWSDAAGNGAPADSSRYNDIVLTFAWTGKAERWFDII